MANLALAYENLMDGATITEANSGDWTTLLPLSNSQDRLISRFARSTDADPNRTYFDFDLGDTEGVNVFSLVRHNLEPGATYRLVLSVDTTFAGIPFDLTGASIDYDSGVVEAWPSVFSTQDSEWEANNWWFGRQDEEKVNAYGQTNIIHVINNGVAVSARYGRVYIVQAAGASDAFVQFGRSWLGPWFQPDRNYVYGASLDWKPLTTRRQALGGVKYYRKRRMVRSFRFAYDALSEAEAYEIFDIKRILDIDGQVIIIADPDNEANSFQRNFLGNVSRPDAVTQPEFSQFATAFEIEEEV